MKLFLLALAAALAALTGCAVAGGPAARVTPARPAAAAVAPAATPTPTRPTLMASSPTPAASSPCPASGTGKSVEVSITEQHLWLCDAATAVFDTPVTTGSDDPADRTPTGTWAIQHKQTDRWLGGPGYSVQVRYWMPYDVDFGFHDAAWQTVPFGSDQWHTAGSHGCVHLPTPAMAFLYGWADVGTAVTVAA